MKMDGESTAWYHQSAISNYLCVLGVFFFLFSMCVSIRVDVVCVSARSNYKYVLCNLTTDVPDPPGRPLIMGFTSRSVNLSWAPSLSSHGSPISHYIIHTRYVLRCCTLLLLLRLSIPLPTSPPRELFSFESWRPQRRRNPAFKISSLNHWHRTSRGEKKTCCQSEIYSLLRSS